MSLKYAVIAALSEDVRGCELYSTLQAAHHMMVFSKHGQKYLCTLPPQVVGDNSASDDNSVNETKDQFINVSALLQPLTKQACLTKVHF